MTPSDGDIPQDGTGVSDQVHNADPEPAAEAPAAEEAEAEEEEIEEEEQETEDE